MHDQLTPYLEFCEYRKELDKKTIKRKIVSLKAFFNYLEEEEILTDNPLTKIRVKFVNCRGGRFSEQSVRLMLKKYTRAVGIKRNIIII